MSIKKYGQACVWNTILIAQVALSAPGDIERVAQGPQNEEGNGQSRAGNAAFSADGRFLVFEADASNLIPNDFNDRADIFVRDRFLGTTELVSAATTGEQANSVSNSGSISRDGRFVVFNSAATNLGSTSAAYHVYVRDRLIGSTAIIGQEHAGRYTQSPIISGNGQVVVYLSYASDGSGKSIVYSYDAGSGTEVVVSLDSAGLVGDGFADSPSVSFDGRFVAFRTDAPLVADDTNGVIDIYVRDRLLGNTERITPSITGPHAGLVGLGTSMSDDGRFVTFHASPKMVVPSACCAMQTILHDRQDGALRIVSIGVSGAIANDTADVSSLSGDGRYVAFRSLATNLTSNDSNGLTDIFVRDVQLGITARVSVGEHLEESNGATYAGVLSADGRFVALTSEASNLVIGDSNGVYEILVKELGDLTAPIVQLETSGTQHNGFFTSDVTGTWMVTDAESAIFYRSECEDVSVTTDGYHLFECQASSAGGTKVSSQYVVRDTLPPTDIAAEIVPNPNSVGWNRTDVWAVASGVDAIAGLDYCEELQFTQDGAGQSGSISCVDFAGNRSAPVAVGPINIDRAPPMVEVATPSNGSNYLQNSVVLAGFSCSDSLSDVSSCSGSAANGAAIATDAVGPQSFSVSSTDMAGNASSVTVNYAVVPTPAMEPVVTPVLIGPLGNDGWYVGNVSLTWNVTSPTPLSATTGCQVRTIKTNTAGVTYTCSATNADGTTSESVTIKKDATAPNARATAKPGKNAAGWRKAAVTVTFTASDGVSGIASCSPPIVLASEGVDQSASGTCTNNAGLVSMVATANDIDIDLTLPGVTVGTPTDGAVYVRNSNVSADYVCSDALSGIASCTGPIVSGASIGTSRKVTNKAFIVTGKDAAGNITKTTVHYSVL